LATPPKKIITIDDEAPIRNLIRHSLRREPYEIVEAGNGREGLEIIRRELPDLIVMDVVMPEMNGLDTLKAIRADAKIAHIPVLLLTGVRDSEKLGAALQMPRTKFLAKPFLVEALKADVRKMMAETNGENNAVTAGS
jgi:DNA-binding response OmpR family regulator